MMKVIINKIGFKLYKSELFIRGGMEKSILMPKGMHHPVAEYSLGFKVEGKHILFLAGEVALDASGNVIGAGDLRAQVKQTFKNIKLLLEEGGATFSNVVKFTTYLRNYEDVQKFWEIRKELFSQYFQDGVYPPNSIIVVTSLYREDLLVEIETLAVTD